MLQFHCPHCGGIFQIDAALGGQQVACPLCGGAVTIGTDLPPPQSNEPSAQPEPSPPPEPATSLPVRQQLGCPLCGGPFEVTAEMSGRQVACPHCGGLVMVPADPLETPPPALGVSITDVAAETRSESDAMAPVAMAAAFSAAIDKPGNQEQEREQFASQEGTKKLVLGDKIVEIRRLTPEEKARRRFRRNLIMIVVGSAILLITLLILSLRHPPPESPASDEPPSGARNLAAPSIFARDTKRISACRNHC